jgi:hypothetical protein
MAAEFPFALGHIPEDLSPLRGLRRIYFELAYARGYTLPPACGLVEIVFFTLRLRMKKRIHRRDPERAEITQRLAGHATSLRSLSVLCVSAVMLVISFQSCL